MTQWTEEQEQAIVLKNRRLLVSAAAGSGKTAVLTERIVRRITDLSDPVDIDSLLVMTFTRAAASEMKERIRKRLEEALLEATKEKTSSRLVSRLQRQMIHLDGAKITTIDSFCLNLIREHVNETDLDPSFRVGGEEEFNLLRNDSMEELLEEAYQKKEAGFLRFVSGFSKGKSDVGIAELLLSVYQFSESMAWPDDWLNHCMKEAEMLTEGGEAIENAGWIRCLLSGIREEATDLLVKAEYACKLCEEENGPSGYLDTVMRETALLRRLSAAENYSAAEETLNAFQDWNRIGINKKNTDANKAEKVKEMRDFWKSCIQKLIKIDCAGGETQMKKDLLQEADTIRTVVSLVRKFREIYTQKKRLGNLLDFSDLEHTALSLLWKKEESGYEKTALSDNIAGAFREIYVDEYQDSNGVQEALLRAIDRGAVFLVGDIKQSIYAFRQAKPELFSEKYKAYQRYTKDDPIGEHIDTRIDLRKNFRSRREVLESANRVFSQLMNETVGGIVYDECAALNPGADYPYPAADKPDEETGKKYRTELLLAETSAYDEEEKQAETEAHLIADRILKLMDRENGFQIYDVKRGRFRTAEFRDMVILLRASSGQAEAFSEVLMREGIPAFAEQKSGYFDALEVRTVLSLLSAIDNPLQDIPLAAVLHSPIGKLCSEELALLLSEQGEEGTLYDRLQKACESTRFPEVVSKLKNIFLFLEEAAEKSVYLSLPELLKDLLETSGYLLYVSALPGGEVRKANLDMLILKAGDYEKTGYRGLYDFIRYVERLKKYDTDYGEASAGTDAGNAVRIMTVHKSKGLEFPVVFLAGTGRRFNLRDAQAGIIMEEKLGLASDVFDLKCRTKGSSLKKNAIAKYLKTEALGEELRVLYVAMTRAKEKLILTAAVSDPYRIRSKILSGIGKEWMTGADIRAAGCVLDWIVMAMAGDIKHCDMDCNCVSVAHMTERNVSDGKEILSTRKKLHEFLEQEETDQKEWEAFRFLNVPYPYEEDVTLRVKRTVSELKMETEEKYAKKHFDLLPKGGAERGTAYHKVMEKLDYSLSEKGKESMHALTAFLDELERKGILSKEEREFVKEADLYAFLQSPLGIRMAGAYKRGDLHREAQFVMEIPACEMEKEKKTREPVLVQGVIDAWFSEDDRIILVDYKTDRVQCGEELKLRYEKQLHYYARALSMMEDREVCERVLWSFALQMAISC